MLTSQVWSHSYLETKSYCRTAVVRKGFCVPPGFAILHQQIGYLAPQRMPRVNRSGPCDVHTDACQCYKQANPVTQSLEELDFLISACAAAQQGNVRKLQAILERHPEAVQSDYTSGEKTDNSRDSQSRCRQLCQGSTAYTGGRGYTPLHYAARGGHRAAVDYLLQCGESLQAFCVFYEAGPDD